MKTVLILALFFATNVFCEDWEQATSIYDFKVQDIKGKEVSLEKYKKSVVLIVNVASYCGYTQGHYDELNTLYDKYHSQGLEILGFPCNQFGYQEPDTNEDICSFVEGKGVKFDMFAKIDVNGDAAHPLFKYLKSKQSGTIVDAIKWNFTKFLVDKNGIPVGRYGPNVSPFEIEGVIRDLLMIDQRYDEL